MKQEDEELDLNDQDQQELYEHYRIAVDKGQSLVRIDKFLVNRIEGISRSRIQAAADADSILVNDKAVKSSYQVKPLDIISIVLPQPPRVFELLAENIPIDIIYEDEHVAMVNKKPGMVVHPGHGNYTGTLVNALIWHFKDLPGYASGELRPGLVHRIDKNTSGILLVAKNEIALNKLAKQFFNHTVDRRYHALVWGDMPEDEGTIIGNIGRSQKDRKKMDVYTDETQGKHAITHWKVLERFAYVNLIECKLETGRTHQIRAHFEHIGHPLFNDDTYSGDKILKGTTFPKYKQFVENCFALCPRTALHAKSLAFDHPATKKRMVFDSDIPDDMKAIIEKWRGYVKGRG